MNHWTLLDIEPQLQVSQRPCSGSTLERSSGGTSSHVSLVEEPQTFKQRETTQIDLCTLHGAQNLQDF